MMNRPLTRRALLCGLLAAPAVAAGAAAPFAADGPARQRAGAANGVLLDVVAAGGRLVACGERGHVLLSDDQGQSWRQARAVPTRATLTALHATDAQTLWAVGHGGVILRSGDGGENWSIMAGTADGADVLLCIRVEADGHGLAVGGFGIAQATRDGGRSWKPVTLLEGEAGEKHLNRIFLSGAGTWLLAVEGGHVLRSSDRGGRWQDVKTPYAGSLWTGMALPGGVLLAAGMRGNVVRSVDDGRSWTHHPVPGAGSLTGTAVLPDGRAALVGVDGTLVVGDAAGLNFSSERLKDRVTLTAAVALAGGALVASGMAGMRLLDLPR